MHKRTLGLLSLVTLLMGADGGQLTTADLPSCADHTYLVYRGGKVVCEVAAPPSCGAQLLHATPGGDLAALSCTPQAEDVLSKAQRQRVTDLQQRAQRILDKLDALGIVPPTMVSFAGNTKAQTAGRIVYPGVAAGLPAANAQCADEFGAAAHMCSLREMVGAVISKTLDPQVDVVPAAWLYMPTWNAPAAATQPLSGVGDNCSGYTDATSASSLAGMAVDWSLTQSNIRALHFYSGTAAACDQPRSIACCR